MMMALIEIDGEQLGLPSYKMGGFSMANCECHNQRVNYWWISPVWADEKSQLFVGIPILVHRLNIVI